MHGNSSSRDKGDKGLELTGDVTIRIGPLELQVRSAPRSLHTDRDQRRQSLVDKQDQLLEELKRVKDELAGLDGEAGAGTQ